MGGVRDSFEFVFYGSVERLKKLVGLIRGSGVLSYNI